MKRCVPILAMAVLAIGCSERPPSSAGAQAGGGAGPIAPTDEEARAAYRDYLYRLTCGDVEDCGELWRQQPSVSDVSQVACVPVRRPGVVRCTFVAEEMTGAHSWHLHLCAGLFRRRGSEWRVLSILGECFPRLPVR